MVHGTESQVGRKQPLCPLCKLTDENDRLLYYRISGETKLRPAIYSTLKSAFSGA